MEDVSKALLIAGGILFAVLTLSLSVILYNNIQTMTTADDEATAIEQLATFNAQYEAFNKEKLYGAEVITAVNKAIENNYKAQDDENDPWYINVKINVGDEEFKSTVIRVEKKKAFPSKKILTGGEIESLITSSIIDRNAVTEGRLNGEISLGTWENGNNFQKLRMNDGIISFFSASPNDSTAEDINYKYTIYSSLKSFKSRIFSGNVNYNNGRINEIIFNIEPIN